MSYEEKIGAAIEKIAEGHEAEGQEMIESVVQNLKEDISKTGGLSSHYQAWAVCCEVMEEYEQALLKYEKILTFEPDNRDVLWRMASIAYDCLDNPETARVIVKERLLQLEPENTSYLRKLEELEELIKSRAERLKKDSVTGNKTPPPTAH